MNNNARHIIQHFGSEKNKWFLLSVLSAHFQSNTVNCFLRDNMTAMMTNFMYRTEQDFSLSDPMPGVTVRMQVESLNKQFINEKKDYIVDHVLRMSDDVPEFTVTDRMPTSRFGQAHHAQRADDILAVWRDNPTRGVQGRDDTIADTLGGRGMGYGMGTPGNANNFWGPSHGSRTNPLDACQFGSNAHTGVTFCDQSDLNTSNHVEQFNGTFYMQKLNADSQAHTNVAFGNSTPESDARLLSRRNFKDNERGEENGIPAYRTRIQRRNHDSDAAESLQGVEREGMIHGHDMTSLYARVDHKRNVRDSQGGGYGIGQYGAQPSSVNQRLQKNY